MSKANITQAENLLLKEKGDAIAKAIAEIPTELRGNLFMGIGKKLQQNAQGYTGSLFLHIAKAYGVKE